MIPLRKFTLSALTVSILTASAGCQRASSATSARAGDLTIYGAYAFQPVTLDEAAVYFRVANAGDQPDTLTAVFSDISTTAVLHGEGMSELGGLAVPPHRVTVLEPGKGHLMLVGLSRIPKSGERIGIRLEFRRAGSVTLEVPVRPYGR